MISVIIPAYNVEKYISRCIDSILAQTNRDWEMLLIDDGSSDGTGSICDRYASQDERIRVFHRKNSGVSAARNLGIENSVGEYLIFLDADDRTEPEMLSELLNATETENVDFSACDSFKDYLEPDGSIRTVSAKKWGDMKQPKIVSGKDMYYTVFLKSATLWNKLIRRDTIGDVRFNCTLSYGEDTDFLLRVMRNAKSCIIIPYQGYHYFINRSGNVRSAEIDKRSIELLNNAVNVYRELSEKNMSALGVYRITVVIWEVLTKIPENCCRESKYEPYISACRKAAATPPLSQVLSFLTDPAFRKGIKLRYLLARLDPIRLIEKKKK